MALRVFPVAGPAKYVDDFGILKPDGRRHQGVDIHAAAGTPIVAVDDGVAHGGEDPRGGHVVNLVADDGTRYYYAHEGNPITLSGRVNAGDVLGVVGSSGNAQGTDPHCHFEMHPGGGVAVNPYFDLKAAEGVAAQPPAEKTSPWWAALGMIAGAGVVAFVIRSR